MIAIRKIVLLLTLILSACGGGDGGGGGTKKTPEKIVDPWAGIDSGSVPGEGGESVTDQLRVLEFNDNWAVRYDGSDGEGGEEVCRRQIIFDGNDNNRYYHEVCMSLEDDPYFVMLPNSALVWHPTMFDRFATDLMCYRYGVDEGRGAEADCFEIFLAMGGEGFTCQAGPVNGDKALRCSDDWAVVVNGDDDDTKTVCRVHLSDNSGRCLGAPKQGVERDEALILPMQQTSWEGYRSMRDNPGQFGEGDVTLLITPQDLPLGAQLHYSSDDETVCTVDNDDSDENMGGGVIMEGLNLPTTCRMVLRVEAEGYADRILFAELPILAKNDASWGDYHRPNNFFFPGEALLAAAVTSTEPAATQNRYESLDESVCTVHSETGKVAAVAPGECMVRLTATAWDYLDVVIDKVIPVDTPDTLEGNPEIGWAAFDGLDDSTAVVGAAAVILDPPEVTDSSLEVTVSRVSGDCEYAGGQLSFDDTTECVLAVTASGGRRYRDVVEEFRITPAEGTFVLTWTGYDSGATFGSDAPTLTPPSVAPSLEGVIYSWAADGGGCEVDAESGALTIVGADISDKRSCTVTLTAAHSGYHSVEVEQTVAVAKKALFALTVPEHPYGGIASLALDNGENLEIVHPSVFDEGDIVYTSADEAVCKVDASGTVTPVAVGTCTISVHGVSSDENYADSAPVVIQSIHIIAGSSTAGAWGSDPYGASAEVGVGGTLGIAAGKTPSGTSILYGSETPDTCIVADDGEVTGVGGGTCRVRFRDGGDSSNPSTPWSDATEINVAPATIPVIENPYGTSPKVGLWGELELEVDLSMYGTATFKVSSGNCEVDGDGVITPTADAAIGDVCVVQVAFAANTNYEAWPIGNFATVTVAAGAQTVTISEPYGEEPTLGVGGTLALVNPPVATAGEDAGGAVSYRNKDMAESICAVAADGTVTGKALGECTVQAKAAAPTNTDYAPTEWIDVITLTVGVGVLTELDWNPGVVGRVGTDLVLMAVNVGSTGAAVVYSVVEARDTGCAFEGNSGAAARTLSFEAWGLCTVRAEASAAGYRDWVREKHIRVRPGTISVTPGSFTQGDTLKVGGDTETPGDLTGKDPSDADFAWELVRGERDCTLVDSVTGEVRANAVSFEGGTPLCSLQVVARKRNYETRRSDGVSIPLEAGDMGEVTVRYGRGVSDVLPLGEGHVDIASLTEANGLDISMVDVSVQGDGVCSVDSEPDSPTYGRVSVVEGAAVGDSCPVTVTVSSPGYADGEGTVALSVSGELDISNIAPVLVYDEPLQIGVATPLAPGGDTDLPADNGATPP